MTFHKTFPIFFAVVMAFLLSLSRCHKDVPKGFPKIYPCKITLTHEGNPAEGVRVYLFSKGEKCPWAIAGVTDSNGVAVIKTHGQYVGAPKGTFAVVLEKTETEGNGILNELSPVSRDEVEAVKTYSLVGVDYTATETTPIEIQVNGKTEQAFEIGPKVRVLMGTDNG